MPLYKKYNSNPRKTNKKQVYSNYAIDLQDILSIKLNRNFYPTLELHTEFLLVHHYNHIHQPKPAVFGEFSKQIF